MSYITGMLLARHHDEVEVIVAGPHHETLKYAGEALLHGKSILWTGYVYDNANEANQYVNDVIEHMRREFCTHDEAVDGICPVCGKVWMGEGIMWVAPGGG